MTCVRALQVVCPDGVHEGDDLSVVTECGQELLVEVPPGVEPGDEFEIVVS